MALIAAVRTTILIVAALVAPVCVAQSSEVVIGVLAPEGAEEALRDWGRLADYLSGTLSQSVRLEYYDLSGMRAAVAREEVAFVVTNPGDYVELEAAYGAHRIATLENAQALSPTEAIASAIVVRADRADLAGFGDLAGKRVLAVSKQAFGGYQVAWHELRQHGVEPERDFASLRFMGFPLQKIVQAVARGEADAGIVRACVLENMASRGDISLADFRVLAARAGDRFPCRRSTRLYPDWPIAALRQTPHDLSKRVATALLGMPATAGGFSWTVPTDYQSVHDLFRNLETGPYAYLREHSLAAFLKRHSMWFVLAGMLVAGWAVHTVRVDYQVHARTRELRQALEARVAMERHAHAQQEKLDHLARLGILGELSSLLAHELNQPLAAIGNFARGMERRIESGRLDPEPLLEGSREIAEQADRARAIMQRIRGFARKREAARAPFRLADAIDTAVTLFAAIGAQASPVERHVDADVVVVADRLQIEQVLLNLLKNAFDAMQDTPPDERRMLITCQREGMHAKVCVTDSGCGLDEVSRTRLFEPFFTTKPEGLGLGLALCKSVVEAHGGGLSALPATPGLTLCLTLPAAEGEPSDA